jgi:hypothetical protein
MSIQEPLKISKINMNNIIYTKTKYSEDRKKKIIYIKYSDKKNNIKNFVFQTPTLLNNKKPELVDGFYELEIPLVTKREKNQDEFLKFLNKIDEKILYDANINSKSWFDIITEDNIYRQRIVRDSIEDHECFIKIKIINTQGFKTIIRLNNNKNISVEEIPQFSWVKMILECYAITISNYGINLFVRPVIMSFNERIIENYNYKFINDSDNESDNESDRTTQVFNTSNIFINKDEHEKTNENNDDPKNDNSNNISENNDSENDDLENDDSENDHNQDIELNIMVNDDDEEESELIENILENENNSDLNDSITSHTSTDV